MRRVKSRGTAPEVLVRKLLSSLGYRYRLHRTDLPGKPDIAFIGRRKVIFVNGCFWHGHDCKRGARVPKTNRDYWLAKIERNRQRDMESLARLHQTGWDALVLFECDLHDETMLGEWLIGFLKDRVTEVQIRGLA